MTKAAAAPEDDAPEFARVALADLNEDPENARLHPEDNIAALVKILTRSGQPEALVVQKSRLRVIAGNGRLRAMKALRWTHCWVNLKNWTDQEAREYSIAANRTSELSTWDTELLEKQLNEMPESLDLADLGFDQDAIDDLFDGNRGDAEDVDEDDVPEPPKTPKTKPGDLYILGRHRLVCGDSRMESSLLLALDGEAADAVVTDPPYGVSYVGKTAEALTIKNDGSEGLRELLGQSLPAAAKVCRTGATWFVCAPAGPQFKDFAEVLSFLEIWRQTLVWVKDSLVMGHSDFHYRHEVIFYGWVPGAPHTQPPDRKQDTVWEINRPKRSTDHPTMKPIELMAKCLENGSKHNDLVLEPFGGSGTTLMACEQMDRRCAIVEIDPAYCDVIVARFEQQSGQKATRIPASKRKAG